MRILTLRCSLIAALLPIGPPAVAADSPDAPELIQRHLRENAPFWADGDTLTFFHQGDAEGVTLEFAGESLPLHRLARSDVWTLALNRPWLDRAVFSYRLMPKTAGQPPPKTPSIPPVWRGPKAPRAAVEVAELKGQLKTVDAPSVRFPGGRRVTVYLPPGHDRSREYRVVYAADGEIITPFTRVLEPLIEAGRIPPVVIIGVHSGSYLGPPMDWTNYDSEKDLRGQEYFPGLKPERFAAHEAFFSDEIPTWAEREFAVSPNRVDRAVFGFSNGGRFAVEMGLRHSDRFGHVFGFSVAGDGQFANLPSGPGIRSSYYLASGLWEEPFDLCTTGLAEALQDRGVSVELSRRVGGHDAAIWRDEFTSALRHAFGKD